MNAYIQSVIDTVKRRDNAKPEYIQSVEEVFSSLTPVIEQHPEYVEDDILTRMVEPDRLITFRVAWVDDDGKTRINRGYRVQFNSSIGPYKGGLRFHPSVNSSIMYFLGFEQTFKNSLTGLPMGGAKGGSDFDPRGKSKGEVMRFCQAFMLELWRNIGPDTDVPAGDVGVGGREIGYLFGMYKKLAREHTGVLTGKGMAWGGSLIRPEATGYGAVYFVQHVLHHAGLDIKGMRVAVSGFGNVAWGTAKKATELGAKVVAISGPDGVVEISGGMTQEQISYMLELRASNNNVVAPFAQKFPGTVFTPGKKAWSVKCDIAMPCAFQNEMSEDDARELIAGGVKLCAEVSNMGCTPGAISAFQSAGVMFAPGKAVNAGGVATSGLEMTQNAMHLSWTAEEVDAKLHEIMRSIHETCVVHGTEPSGYVNYVKGANIAGFMKVARAMLEQGVI